MTMPFSTWKIFVFRKAKFRLKLHYIYFLMAGLDLLILSGAIWNNHLNIERYSQSVLSSQKYVKISESLETLSDLVAAANAPGNDIFESRDANKEHLRLAKAVEEYEVYLNSFRQNDFGVQVDRAFEKVDWDLRTMVGTAGKILKNFENHHETKAAAQMAVMDRQFSALNKSLSRLRIVFNEMHFSGLLAHESGMKKANRYEIMLISVFGILVLMVAVFGFIFTQRSEDSERTMIENSKMVALGEMAGSLMHEINNPLAIVRTKASQLKRLIASGRFEKDTAISFLKDIEETSIRMTKISDGLRTFTRSSENEQMVNISINKIVSDVQGICQERLLQNEVGFEIEKFDDFEIFCRPVQIEQILVNLINNSFDAICTMPKAWIRLSVSRAGKFVELSVTDSGNGIPDNIADKIGRTFFTTKPIGKGTGLGLSISLRLAEAHGGMLELNRKSKNTQFVLKLPIGIYDKNSKMKGA